MLLEYAGVGLCLTPVLNQLAATLGGRDGDGGCTWFAFGVLWASGVYYTFLKVARCPPSLSMLRKKLIPFHGRTGPILPACRSGQLRFFLRIKDNRAS